MYNAWGSHAVRYMYQLLIIYAQNHKQNTQYTQNYSLPQIINNKVTTFTLGQIVNTLHNTCTEAQTTGM